VFAGVGHHVGGAAVGGGEWHPEKRDAGDGDGEDQRRHEEGDPRRPRRASRPARTSSSTPSSSSKERCSRSSRPAGYASSRRRRICGGYGSQPTASAGSRDRTATCPAARGAAPPPRLPRADRVDLRRRDLPAHRRQQRARPGETGDARTPELHAAAHRRGQQHRPASLTVNQTGGGSARQPAGPPRAGADRASSATEMTSLYA
jgi:hypothetical protein